MKINRLSFCAAAGCALLFTAGAAWAGTTEYQVTGAVTAVSPTVINVVKGKENFEIARTPETKATGGEVKVGDRATVHYTMTAVAIEDKGVSKAKKQPKPAAAPAPEAPAKP